jgi:hypothetical protein
VSMKSRALWDVAPCSLGVDWRFRGACSVHHQGCPSAYCNETTQLYIPEGSNLLMFINCCCWIVSWWENCFFQIVSLSFMTVQLRVTDISNNLSNQVRKKTEGNITLWYRWE